MYTCLTKLFDHSAKSKMKNLPQNLSEGGKDREVRSVDEQDNNIVVRKQFIAYLEPTTKEKILRTEVDHKSLS